jgi:hypothetical protein
VSDVARGGLLLLQDLSDDRLVAVLTAALPPAMDAEGEVPPLSIPLPPGELEALERLCERAARLSGGKASATTSRLLRHGIRELCALEEEARAQVLVRVEKLVQGRRPRVRSEA